MNLSGLAVRYWLTKLKIDVKNLLVVTDDLNLEVGNLRMKKNGSDGGHNGLKDIQQTLSSNQYPRLRIGVGNNFPKGKQIDYVLGEWTKEEDLVLNQKMKIINGSEVEFNFAVDNYQLGAQTDSPNAKKLANSGKGQHIHFIINNQPYSAHYESKFKKKIPSF